MTEWQKYNVDAWVHILRMVILFFCALERAAIGVRRRPDCISVAGYRWQCRTVEWRDYDKRSIYKISLHGEWEDAASISTCRQWRSGVGVVRIPVRSFAGETACMTLQIADFNQDVITLSAAVTFFREWASSVRQ